MKRIILFAQFFVFSYCVFSQETQLNSNEATITKDIVKTNSIDNKKTLPKFSIGLGAGINNFTSLLGVSGSIRLDDKLTIRSGYGIGAWGTKYSIGIKYVNKYDKNWSYCLGYSKCPGEKNLLVNLDLNSGAKKLVLIDLLSASTINLSLNRSWMLGKSNTFYTEIGYAIPLETTPWVIKDGSDISSLSKSTLNLLKPGGLILGLGFTFGI